MNASPFCLDDCASQEASIAEVRCFGAVPARTAATDREVRGFSLGPLTQDPRDNRAAGQLWRERLTRRGRRQGNGSASAPPPRRSLWEGSLASLPTTDGEEESGCEDQAGCFSEEKP